MSTPFIMRDEHATPKSWRVVYAKTKARGLRIDEEPIGNYVISASRGGRVLASGDFPKIMDWLETQPVVQKGSY